MDAQKEKRSAGGDARTTGTPAPLDAVTLVGGREVPEEEVNRRAGVPPARSFQVRSAETVIQGARRRRGAQAGKPAPPEAPALAERSFQVREAGTVTLRPPHWAGLIGPLEAGGTPAPPEKGGKEGSPQAQTIRPMGIPSGEKFGIPAITPGPPPGAEKEDK